MHVRLLLLLYSWIEKRLVIFCVAQAAGGVLQQRVRENEEEEQQQSIPPKKYIKIKVKKTKKKQNRHNAPRPIESNWEALDLFGIHHRIEHKTKYNTILSMSCAFKISISLSNRPLKK